jgi:hypothetical protein
MELLRKSGKFVTNWLQDWTTMLIESEMICVAARLLRVGGLCDSRDVSQAPPWRRTICCNRAAGRDSSERWRLGPPPIEHGRSRKTMPPTAHDLWPTFAAPIIERLDVDDDVALWQVAVETIVASTEADAMAENTAVAPTSAPELPLTTGTRVL